MRLRRQNRRLLRGHLQWIAQEALKKGFVPFLLRLAVLVATSFMLSQFLSVYRLSLMQGRWGLFFPAVAGNSIYLNTN